jgi:dTDP-4-amino-4,6-dideoxygalactose transaminase
VLSLPLFPELSLRDVERVAEALVGAASATAPATVPARG